MPDVHYPDCVAEANRDELRRMESLLERLRAENAKLRGELFDAENRLARHRASGRG